MSWQQPTNGNWNANGSSEDLRARSNAQRGGFGQQLSLNEQLALQNLGLTGTAQGTLFPNYVQTSQQSLFPNQFNQSALNGGQAGLHMGNDLYGKLNALQAQGGIGLNNLSANQQSSAALITLLRQQMFNMQQNGGYQNQQQLNHINSNLAQTLALAQQQQQSTARNNPIASIANNPPALNAYLYRLNQSQMQNQAQRQLNFNQSNAAQLLHHQMMLNQVNQMQAAQQQQQMSANMAALFKTTAGFGDNQLMGNHGNAASNLVGFNSTSLANSVFASAPLLPILGADLAKPSQRTHDNNISFSSPDIAKQMEALNFGSQGYRTGSVSSLADAIGRTQAMSPSGLQPKDVRMGLSSPMPTHAANGGQNSGGGTTTSPSAGSKDRDLTTLKTLGQMLAKTGNTVESAVQNGLLGGCNAEDVKIVWEAYILEVASLKEHNAANKDFQRKGLGLVARRAKSDDPETTKLLMEALGKASPASVPSTLSEALEYLGMDAYASPPSTTLPSQSKPAVKREDPVENDSAWDGVIENEGDFVPHNLIDEVNTPDLETNEISKDAFNAGNYDFFPSVDDGLADCPLEDEEATNAEELENTCHGDVTKSEDNNNTADDDLPTIESTLKKKSETEEPSPENTTGMDADLTTDTPALA